MMKKKILALLLATVMVLGLAACGGGNDGNSAGAGSNAGTAGSDTGSAGNTDNAGGSGSGAELTFTTGGDQGTYYGFGRSEERRVGKEC